MRLKMHFQDAKAINCDYNCIMYKYLSNKINIFSFNKIFSNIYLILKY